MRVLRFRRNYGQTAAMQAGLEHARGQIIVTLDGDLQNDPADIPQLIAKLDEGHDLVHGWRRHRQDAWLSRTLPSKIANAIISRSTQFPIHDLGCTLKAMRREIADDLELYGQMHRFIPILAAERGARCAEVVTHHRPAPIRHQQVRHLADDPSPPGSVHGQVHDQLLRQPHAVVRQTGHDVLRGRSDRAWWPRSG